MLSEEIHKQLNVLFLSSFSPLGKHSGKKGITNLEIMSKGGIISGADKKMGTCENCNNKAQCSSAILGHPLLTVYYNS